ncbi:hypothetical protein LXL04_010204 [Taraxacum kok-saghyz]
MKPPHLLINNGWLSTSYGLWFSYFMRGDIHAVAGFGCPSIDRKVVNSRKRLRAYIGIDEGNVCSSCDLRGKCERAFVKAREEEEDGRTVDVMRFVLTYGLHHLNHSPDSKPYMNKRLEEAIRSLIRDMVKFSKTELDFDPSKCAPFVHRSDKNSCEYHERIESLGDNRDQAELKRGDWICIRCKFFNFAKNIKCLQCHTNPPKRQLNPGEWECRTSERRTVDGFASRFHNPYFLFSYLTSIPHMFVVAVNRYVSFFYSICFITLFRSIYIGGSNHSEKF